MQFNRHTNLEGLHAPFGASKSSWLRYDDDKVKEVYFNLQAAAKGTEIHEWAAATIKLGRKQPRSTKNFDSINAYINDAIGFKMDTEVVLFYSERFFGTADAICFRNNTLRIHDLKTGKIPAKMEQLEIYAALFCLEYNVKPGDIEIELRIYQNNEVIVHNPTVEDILPVMDKIIHVDKLLRSLDGYEEG